MIENGEWVLDRDQQPRLVKKPTAIDEISDGDLLKQVEGLYKAYDEKSAECRDLKKEVKRLRKELKDRPVQLKMLDRGT